MLYRELRFVGNVDEKTRTVPVVVSTETPVDRGTFFEILDHGPGGCDLSRAPLPLIESHDDRRLNIAVVENMRVEGGKLRGDCRFGTSNRADEVLADVKARVVRGVSIGYELLDQGRRVEHSSGRALKFKFRPYEVSVVAVPADITGGFYRSQRKPMNDDLDVADRDDHLTRSQRRRQGRDDSDAVEVERERAKTIMSLATRHNLREMGQRHLDAGTALEVFRGLMLDELHKRGSDKPLHQPPTELGLSSRDAQRFSVARFMRSLIEGDPKVAPFERECADAVTASLERVGIRAQHSRGAYLPYEVFRQPIPGARMVGDSLMIGDQVVASTRDLSTSTTAAGGAMVATDLLYADFIDLLRNRTLVRLMGARYLDGLVGNVSIPRQSGSTTMNWVAQGGAATESDAAFNLVSLTPKTAHGIQDFTRDLLLQATPAVEGLVRADLLNTMAVQLDFVALHGTGASNQPTGIANTAGIGSVAGGANGAAPTWDNVVDLEASTANANSFDGTFGYLTNSKVWAKLKKTQRFSGTNGDPVWQRAIAGDNPGLFGMVNDYRCGVSNNVRSDLTKGSSSGVCSAIFWGVWSDLLIGGWGGVELLPDNVTQAANRIIRMHVYQTIDVAVRRATSFAVMADALTT